MQSTYTQSGIKKDQFVFAHKHSTQFGIVNLILSSFVFMKCASISSEDQFHIPGMMHIKA